MTIYYKNGFFTQPCEGCHQITESDYQALLQGQAQGKMITSDEDGYPILVPPAPTQHHILENQEWVLPKDKQQAVIFAEKSAKLAEINSNAQAFINEMAKYDETPAFERDTWNIQREEAKAWFADKTVATPTLATIAQMRGVPLDLLRQKAYEKAIAYQTVAAVVAGQRQAYEDRLNSAETLEQVQAIEPTYSLPQMGASDE